MFTIVAINPKTLQHYVGTNSGKTDLEAVKVFFRFHPDFEIIAVFAGQHRPVIKEANRITPTTQLLPADHPDVRPTADETRTLP
jgi:hypothetical protein